MEITMSYEVVKSDPEGPSTGFVEPLLYPVLGDIS